MFDNAELANSSLMNLTIVIPWRRPASLSIPQTTEIQTEQILSTHPKHDINMIETFDQGGMMQSNKPQNKIKYGKYPDGIKLRYLKQVQQLVHVSKNLCRGLSLLNSGKPLSALDWSED